jgi:uncharacterized protein (TIGR02266 family)
MNRAKDDKRIKERIPIREEVHIAVKDEANFITEYADNISLGGMFIKSRNPFSIGTKFDLEVLIGDSGQKIKALGEVVWTKEFASDNDSRPSGMGIKFVRLHGDSKKIIQDIMDKCGDE